MTEEIGPEDQENGQRIALILPTEPINNCRFTVSVQADGPVTVEIYNLDTGAQSTRACLAAPMSGPGKIGTSKPPQKMGVVPKTYETEMCLCGLGVGTRIRIVVCRIGSTDPCETYNRTVNHAGCPTCPPTSITAGVDAVVDDLREAVTERVAIELKKAVAAIAPEKPKGKRGRKAKASAEPKPKPTKKRRRRRRG